VGHVQAVNWGQDIHNSKNIELWRVDKNIYEVALAVFEKYNDKQLSFTDCTSFALMKSMGINDVFTFDEGMGINDVFTFDEDFRKMGFNIMPE